MKTIAWSSKRPKGSKYYAGYAEETALRLECNGKAELIHSASGEEIAGQRFTGKKECLVIQAGESFCR